MKTIKIMIIAAITLFMVQCKENTSNANDSQTVASTEEVDNTDTNNVVSKSEIAIVDNTISKNENTNIETKQSSNNKVAPKKELNVEFQPESTTHPKTEKAPKKDSQVINKGDNVGEWYNLRYIDFQLKKGGEMKDQFTIIASSNLKYLLYLNKNNIPELGEVVKTKRQEEDELAQTKAVYTFPTVKAGWLKEPKTKFFIQNDGNLQYVNPNKSYWGLSNGKDKNKDLLHKVDKLMITDDGRIVLVDKSGTEIWSHR